ncbi:MAG: type transport system ATP-binding protein [Frankiales bacterium]|jgi:ABC-2 type transport system ATP-binding protein|nr:type transport system ATP-binding protein [Frankiales bacterium]
MATTDSSAAIAVDGLRKSYGDFEAVRGISFEVRRGEVFALLGPNGAGKTTTLEVLEGFRERTAGSVSVLGMDPTGQPLALRSRVGIVLQDTAVEAYLTVREVLERTAAYYTAPRPVPEVIALVGLEDKADQRVKALSGGQRRRLDVALGIVGRPELVFLDEPTTGFDPSARREAWGLVRDLADMGTTVILTTHYMDEAQTLADRLAIIAKGQIVAEGTPESLGGRDTAAAYIRFQLPPGVAVDELPDQPEIVTMGGAVVLSTDDELRVLHRLTGWALERGVGLAGLSVDRPSLEDVYLRLTTAADEAPAGVSA